MRSYIRAWKEITVKIQSTFEKTDLVEQEQSAGSLDKLEPLSPERSIRTKLRSKQEILGQRRPPQRVRKTFQNRRIGIRQTGKLSWKYYNNLTLIKSFTRKTLSQYSQKEKLTKWPISNREWEFYHKDTFDSDYDSDSDGQLVRTLYIV